jgi:hypothetical protein
LKGFHQTQRYTDNYQTGKQSFKTFGIKFKDMKFFPDFFNSIKHNNFETIGYGIEMNCLFYHAVPGDPIRTNLA